MTEERTVSSTGGEKGVKPEQFSLIPKAPLDLLGRVYNFGTRKYAAHNYRKGYEWSKSYDALQRHLTSWWERDEIDEESGLSHLGHAAWHIFALIVFASEKRYAHFDDRYIHPDVEVAPVERDIKENATALKDYSLVTYLPCNYQTLRTFTGYTFLCTIHDQYIHNADGIEPGFCPGYYGPPEEETKNVKDPTFLARQEKETKDLPENWHDVGPTPEPPRAKCWILKEAGTDTDYGWRCNTHNKTFITVSSIVPEQCPIITGG